MTTRSIPISRSQQKKPLGVLLRDRAISHEEKTSHSNAVSDERICWPDHLQSLELLRVSESVLCFSCETCVITIATYKRYIKFVDLELQRLKKLWIEMHYLV